MRHYKAASVIVGSLMHRMDYLLLPGSGKRQAMFEVSRVLGIRSALRLANAVSGDGVRLL